MPGKWKKFDWFWLAGFSLCLVLALFLRKDSWIILAFVLGFILFVRLIMILEQRLLWKIRNRLIVSTLFFTVTPIILISILFYMIASFLISQYNSLIFENIMQRNLTNMERSLDLRLRLKEPDKIIQDMERITRRRPTYLKMAFFVKRGRGWEIFVKYPEDYRIEQVDLSILMQHFQSGYFCLNGELHHGILRVENDLGGFIFDTINQEYFNVLPRIGDFRVMYQPVSGGPILKQLGKVKSRLESEEFAAFEKYRWPFTYDFRYSDFDDIRNGIPKIKTFSFFIINDYSKAFQRLKGSDPTAYLRREIQSLQVEIAETPNGHEKEAKNLRLAELQRELETAQRNQGEWANSLIPKLIKIFVGLFAFFIICSVFIGFRMTRVVTRSIDQLTKGLERMRKGDFSYRIHIKSRDQMHFLAESFNEMASGIDHLLKEEKERERLEEELRIARSIQLKLLPADVYAAVEFEIAAVNIPAQEIAGDYFDYFYQKGEYLTVLVADVSGKGASAAFYMAELKGIMNYLQVHEQSPVDMICKCHKSLLSSFDKVTFITMNLVRFDLKQHKLVFARSGHTPALFYNSRKKECLELTPAGPAIGLNQLSREAIEEITLPYQTGDLLFFFSDGLSEMMNAEGETLGVARLKSLISENAMQPAVQIRQKILDISIAFSQDKINHDDLTFVVIKIL